MQEGHAYNETAHGVFWGERAILYPDDSDRYSELYTPRRLILPYIKNEAKEDLFFLLYLYEKMGVS